MEIVSYTGFEPLSEAEVELHPYFASTPIIQGTFST